MKFIIIIVTYSDYGTFCRVLDSNRAQSKGILRVQIGPEAHPARYAMGTGTFLKVQNPGCEADHSSQSSVKVKNEWSYTSPSPIYLHGMCRENIYDPSNERRQFPYRPVAFTDWS